MKYQVKRSEIMVEIVIFIMMLAAFTIPLRGFLYGGYSSFRIILLLSFLVAGYTFLSYRRARKICIFQFMWMIVFLITLRNNGDLANGSTASTLNCLIAFFVPFLICQMNFEKKIMRMIIYFVMIHALIGLVFMAFPNVLIANIDKLFPEMLSSQRSFLVSTINNGYLVGITGHYSTSGMYMVTGFIASSALLFYRAIINNTEIIKLNKEFLSTMFFAICLILTGKRAHLLFGVISFCMSYIMIYNRGNFRMRFQRLIKFFIAFDLVFVVALNIPAFQATFQRFMSQQVVEEMMIGRVNSKWLPALELFKENPLFGCGWQQFGYLHPTYNSGDEIARNVHNIYIQLLCETGIVGSLLIIGIMVITFIMTMRRVTELRKQKVYSDEFLFLSFSFSYQLFFLLYGITGNPLYDIQTLFPYMLCCSITYKYCTRRFLYIGRSN